MPGIGFNEMVTGALKNLSWPSRWRLQAKHSIRNIPRLHLLAHDAASLKRRPSMSARKDSGVNMVRGTMSRFTHMLALLAALLMLHGVTPRHEPISLAQTDTSSLPNSALIAAEPASLPLIQPRAPVASSVQAFRIIFVKQRVIPASPAATMTATSAAHLPPVLRETPPVVVGRRPSFDLPRGFDARAPPQLA